MHPEIFCQDKLLVENLGDNACTNGTAAFTDGEAETFVHSDRLDQVNFQNNIVARHNHFDIAFKRHDTSHVRCTEIELRTIAIAEECMTTTFFFGEDINLTF